MLGTRADMKVRRYNPLITVGWRKCRAMRRDESRRGTPQGRAPHRVRHRPGGHGGPPLQRQTLIQFLRSPLKSAIAVNAAGPPLPFCRGVACYAQSPARCELCTRL